MKEYIETPAGTVRPGTVIRITKVDARTTFTPDGIDHQALAMEGKSGRVVHIDDLGTLSGEWGGLGILPGKDEFEILSQAQA